MGWRWRETWETNEEEIREDCRGGEVKGGHERGGRAEVSFGGTNKFVAKVKLTGSIRAFLQRSQLLTLCHRPT